MDAPFDDYSGSTYIFGKTAGVTESVVRYVFALNKIPFNKSAIIQNLLWETTDKSQNIKVFEFSANGTQFRACVVHGG
jgi:iron only hydrogenase large subunit-like protein